MIQKIKVALVFLCVFSIIYAGGNSEAKKFAISTLVDHENTPAYMIGFIIDDNFELLAGYDIKSTKAESLDYQELIKEDIYSLGFKYQFLPREMGNVRPYFGYFKLSGIKQDIWEDNNIYFGNSYESTSSVSGDKFCFGVQYIINSEENIAITAEYGYIKKISEISEKYQESLTLPADEYKMTETNIDSYSAIGLTCYF